MHVVYLRSVPRGTRWLIINYVGIHICLIFVLSMTGQPWMILLEVVARWMPAWQESLLPGRYPLFLLSIALLFAWLQFLRLPWWKAACKLLIVPRGRRTWRRSWSNWLRNSCVLGTCVELPDFLCQHLHTLNIELHAWLTSGINQCSYRN